MCSGANPLLTVHFWCSPLVSYPFFHSKLLLFFSSTFFSIDQFLLFHTGNYDGLGEVRRNEVKKSCSTLGIPEERCVVLNQPDLQDNPKKWWNETVVGEIVSQFVQSWNTDLVSRWIASFFSVFVNPVKKNPSMLINTFFPPLKIITFDQGGISGHINHKAVYAGIRCATLFLPIRTS